MQINYESTCLDLSVKDDGKGFAVPDQPGNLAQGGHYGLLGMQERAELVKSSLEIRSTPGYGTTVSVRLDFTKGEEPIK
jgi:signal transduction histidine kinase